MDTGLVLSAPYAHKCCKIAEIKSESRHYRYKKPGEPYVVFFNEQRPAYSLNYLTPKRYRETYGGITAA